jgi:ribosome assembly protein 4
MLATASGDSTIRVWDMSSQTPVATLAGHESWVQCLSWSPDMQFIVSGGMDKSVFVWDKSAFSSIKKKDTPTVKNGLKGHTGPITSIAWEPLHQCGETDGACTKFATSSKDGTVRVWNAVLKRVVYVLSQHTAPVMCVKWGGNGNIYTASRDKTIKIWNAIDVHFVGFNYIGNVE